MPISGIDDIAILALFNLSSFLRKSNRLKAASFKSPFGERLSDELLVILLFPKDR